MLRCNIIAMLSAVLEQIADNYFETAKCCFANRMQSVPAANKIIVMAGQIVLQDCKN